MGAAQVNSKSQKHQTNTLYDCLLLVFQNIDFLLDPEIIAQLKELPNRVPIPNINKKIKPIFEQLTQIRPPKIVFNEDILQESLSSFLQNYLIQASQQEIQGIENKSNPSIIRDFRLINMRKFEKEPNNDYLKHIFQLYKTLHVYCSIVNGIIQQLDTRPHIQMVIYTILWEQYQIQMPIMKEQFNLGPLNKAFDTQFGQLTPHISVESLMAKIWGTTIKLDLTQYFMECFTKDRQHQRQSHLPLADYFRSIVDLAFDPHQINWIGTSDRNFIPERFQIVLDSLMSTTTEMYTQKYIELQGDVVGLFEFYKKDIEYISQILPKWVVESSCCEAAFMVIEKKIKEEVERMSPEEKSKLVSRQKTQIDLTQMACQGFSLDNFMDFEEVMVCQDQILDRIMKEIKLSCQFSSMVVDSNVSRSSTQPPNSGFIQSEVYGEQVEVEINWIVLFCEKYDKTKLMVTDNRQSRDNRILFRNQSIVKQSPCISQVLNFQIQVNDVMAAELITYLDKFLKNQFIFIQEKHFMPGNSMAEKLGLLQ